MDDDRETCRFMTELLQDAGRQIESASQPNEALALARGGRFDLIVSDMNLNDPGISGLDVLKAFRDANPAGQVVLISGFGTLETAIEASKAGAFDYISKPFNIGEVKRTVERALVQAARGEAPDRTGVVQPPELIGRTSAMLTVYKQIAVAAGAAAPVLVIGESGTGKELVARAVHQHGPRSARPFVPINCGAIAEGVLESELFGHARGAFTGAVADTKGIFEQAHGGTVFLDEITETTSALQVKLLRVLQEGEIRPVGGSRPVRVDVRIVAATNIDLERAVAEQRFRQDLFYRLSVIVITLPPLRDRRPDVPLLVDRFLRNACARAGRQVELSSAALDALVAYSWPGNVRELENSIERLVLFTGGSRIDVADLPAPLTERKADIAEELFLDLPTLDNLERRYLLHVLRVMGGNRTRAANALGIDRRTFYRMAQRFGLDLREDGSG